MRKFRKICLMIFCLISSSSQQEIFNFSEGEEFDYPDINEGQEYEVGYSTCDAIMEDGTVTQTVFDECTSFCCGGVVYLNQTGLDCCGSIYYGSPFYSRVQTCCEWWTGHGEAHLTTRRSRYSRGSIGCCGQHRIIWGQQSCCYGSGLPSVFNPRREICCDGNAIPVKTSSPYRSSCCGNTAAYDKTSQSCPCADGSVLDLPSSHTDCCESEDGMKRPFIKVSQICCNGEVGEEDETFCCDNKLLGNLGKEVCCNGTLTTIDPPDYTLTECCGGFPFNPSLFLCCQDKLVEKFADEDACCGEKGFDSSKSICCQGNIWSLATDGSECCGESAFYNNTGSFCCNGVVLLVEAFDGDTCCGSEPDIEYFYKDENFFVCCENVLSIKAGDSCCGTVSYDPKTSICCNNEVFDKTLGDSCCNGSPYFPSAPGSQSTTICCDNGPYGPFRTPACCNGVGYDIQGGQVCCSGQVYGIYNTPSCCVSLGYDVTKAQCCDGLIVPNPEGVMWAQCCGTKTYSRMDSKCCDGIVWPIPEGVSPSNVQCCDINGVYDPSRQLCCQGNIFQMENRLRSKCCGDVMYDVTKQVCCDLEDNFTPPEVYDVIYGRDNTKCCGMQLYDADKSFCCEGQLEEKIFEESGCCAGRVFDRKLQICCENQLHDISINVPWRRAECCGSVCYYRGPMRCCNNRVYLNNAQTAITCSDY